MSRVQLTKEEAIAKIDQYLDKKFDEIVSEICNEFIATMNENAAAGRKQIKGKISFGYRFYDDFAEISTELDTDAISETIFQSRPNESSIPWKQIVKYTNRWNMDCPMGKANKKVLSFALKKDFGLFSFKTPTYQKFVDEITKRLSKFGVQLGFNLVSGIFCRIYYRCNIPADYVQQPLFEIKAPLSIDQKIEKAKATIRQYLQNLNYTDEDIEEMTATFPNGIMYKTNITSGGRTILFAQSIDAFSVKTMCLIGRIAKTISSKIKETVEHYNASHGADSRFNIDNDNDLHLYLKDRPYSESDDLCAILRDRAKEMANLLCFPEISDIFDFIHQTSVEQAEKTLSTLIKDAEFDTEVERIDDGKIVLFSLHVNLEELQRMVVIDYSIIPYQSYMSIALLFGRVQETNRAIVKQRVQIYNVEHENDFQFILTDAQDEFDGILMLKRILPYNDQTNVEIELTHMAAHVVRLCKTTEVQAFTAYSYPLE